MPRPSTGRHAAFTLMLALDGGLAAPAAAPLVRILIHAGQFIDGVADRPRNDRGILVEGERILFVMKGEVVKKK